MNEAKNQYEMVQATVDIVSAHVANNSMAVADIPGLIEEVYQTLMRLGDVVEPEEVRPDPVVPIKKSITPDYLICLEDGKSFQSLKRHLRVAFGLTPQAYREKWGLPDDYPMVSPAYARPRSDLAKQSGLGKSG